MKNKKLNKKLIFIENKFQALEYLRNKEKINAFPISFTFEVERILENNNVKFKTDDDYGDSIYQGIYDKSTALAKKLCNEISFNYKNINLFQLFQVELFSFISFLLRYNSLFNEIIKKEKPEEIILFKNNNSSQKQDIASKIIPLIFKGKITFLNYQKPVEEQKKFVKIAAIIQSVIAKLYLIKPGKKIFFSGSKKFFEEIILELKDKNDFFRCHNSLQKSFFVGNSYIPFYEFKPDNSNLLKLSSSLANFNKEIDNCNLSFDNKLDPLLRYWIKDLSLNEFILFSSLIDKLFSLFKKKKINLILLDNDVNHFEKTLARVARLFSIPSIVIQHGACGSELGFLPISADYFLAAGEYSKSWLIEKGAGKDKIIVTGSSQYDNFVKNEKKAGKNILYIVDAASNENLIPDHHPTKRKQKEILQIILRAMKNFPDYKLIVKTRAGWDLNDLPSYLAKKSNFKNIKIIENADPIELINSADLVIIHQTTMGLESLLLNKPVISIEFKEIERFSIYNKTKAVKLVYNEAKLVKAMKESLSNPINEKARQEFLKNQLYKLDHQSSKRAIKFINMLLSKKQ